MTKPTDSESVLELTDSELAVMAEQLEIKIENVYHVTFSSGVEMIGELKPDIEVVLKTTKKNKKIKDILSEVISKQILFSHPIKVVRDTWFDEEGLYSNDYFLAWNSCLDGYYVPIDPTSIISICPPNKFAICQYLKAVNDVYFSLTISVELESTQNGCKKNLNTLNDSNVIQFKTHFLKKLAESSS